MRRHRSAAPELKAHGMEAGHPGMAGGPDTPPRPLSPPSAIDGLAGAGASNQVCCAVSTEVR